MTFGVLAAICLIGILGPLFAIPRGWHLPVLLGELVGGVVLGATGFGWLHADDPTFTFFAQVGFVLVMFVAGTHVPVSDPELRRSLRPGLVRAVMIGLVAAVLGSLTSHAFGTGHAALYAVLMASSSAALVLPILDTLQLRHGQALGLIPQVAVADAACVVALPLAIDPAHAGRAALGSLVVITAAGGMFFVLRELERAGVRKRVHDLSEDRSFALELRINLLVLFGLAAIAVRAHVSVLLAGFSLGLAVTAIGPPRRLARQLFALSEGLFGPIFFVWLGAALDLRALVHAPHYIALGLLLGLGAAAAHLVALALGQPLPLGLLAAAQLGVPVAAATIGRQLGVLGAGEQAALLLGALVTIALAVLGGSLAARKDRSTR